MIELIIPPIIIVILIGFLIVLLSRAMRQVEEQDLYVDKPLPNKKVGKLKGYVSGATQTMRSLKDKTEKLAQKRRITAAVEEARTNRKHEEKEEEENTLDEDSQRQRMSRMGEIILNYHREASATAGEKSIHDPAEAHLIQAVEGDPQNPDGYERLGDFYMERQNFEDARECYKYVLRLNPRHRRAQEAMKNLDRVLG